jgi:hypothetical protein
MCSKPQHDIQWFSHGIFVLRPHFLRHRAAYLLHVPPNGQLGENSASTRSP